MSNPAVYRRFESLLADHAARTGFTVPELLLYYLAELCASRIDRVDIIPDPSFAERYLLLYTAATVSGLKDYADSSLFFCSLMPEYGRRRGLDMDYYATLGRSVYFTLAELSEDARFDQLGLWFLPIQQFLSTALHNQHIQDIVVFDR
jgi:hypothetical protein